MCLDGRLLGQIVSGLSGAEVSIEVGAKLKTVLKSGGGKFSLNGFAAEEYPTVKTAEHDAKETTVNAADLAKAFGAVEHCMSTDEARYNLNGLSLKPLMTQTVVAATDGRVTRARKPLPINLPGVMRLRDIPEPHRDPFWLWQRSHYPPPIVWVVFAKRVRAAG